MEQYRDAARSALEELIQVARLEPGDLVVVGCSTSEVAGAKIGTQPGPEIAAALLEGLLPVLRENELYLAAQCCEHLERSLVVEAAAMRLHRLERVNAIPQPKAGGSFATAAYAALEQPVLVREVLATAGLDIGVTMIGMHIRPVVVPVRLAVKKIGEAPVYAARSRPRFAGGERAVYDRGLM